MRRDTGGVGMGLALVSRLAALMGGALSIESAPGRGTTAAVIVPAPEAPPQKEQECRLTAKEPEQEEPEPEQQQQEESPLVLLVDDNAINRRVAGRMLARLGCRVAEAVDGREAVSAYESLHDGLALVLMDCHMPVLDGFAATREIRALERANMWRRVPLTALTADTQDGVEELAASCGMDGVVGKPFSKAQLGALLEAARRPALSVGPRATV